MAHERQKGEGVETSDGVLTTGRNFFPYFFPSLITYLHTYLHTHLLT